MPRQFRTQFSTAFILQLIFNCIKIISEVRFSRCDWCDSKQNVKLDVYKNVIVFCSTQFTLLCSACMYFIRRVVNIETSEWTIWEKKREKERDRKRGSLKRCCAFQWFWYIATTTDKKALHPKFRNSARANNLSHISPFGVCIVWECSCELFPTILMEN